MLPFVFILLVAFAGIQDINAKPPSKIVQGHAVRIEEFPATVSIRTATGHLCGGTLISNKHVLTAAHCVAVQQPNTAHYDYIRPAHEHEVHTGTSSSTSPENAHQVKRIHVHPDYTGGANFYNDIAIFTLEEPIYPNKKQFPARLPNQDVQTGEMGNVAGWGYISETVMQTTEDLRSVPVYIANAEVCKKLQPNNIGDGHICGLTYDGTGFCSGDSGGPLYVGNEIVGIVSFSWYCGDSNPDVYTNVYAYRDWINQILSSDI